VRTAKQIEVRRQRAEAANAMLSWMKSQDLAKGTSVIREIVEPYQPQSNLDTYHCWLAFDILRETDRITITRGGGFEVKSLEPVICLENGSIK
jgi:hypothetical protein